MHRRLPRHSGKDATVKVFERGIPTQTACESECPSETKLRATKEITLRAADRECNLGQLQAKIYNCCICFSQSTKAILTQRYCGLPSYVSLFHIQNLSVTYTYEQCNTRTIFVSTECETLYNEIVQEKFIWLTVMP